MTIMVIIRVAKASSFYLNENPKKGDFIIIRYLKIQDEVMSL